MRILVSGSSGLMGSALVPLLTKAGHTANRLVRGVARAEGDVQWDPEVGAIDQSKLRGVEAVVHLAGENIARSRWTPEVKERIHTSRVRGTRVLSEALARLPERPQVLVSASAVGYYGNRGDEVLTEESGPGQDFLAQVCREWEAATAAASEAGIRAVIPRFGAVLSPTGGALERILPLFRKGIGGRIGSGRQYMSWVAIDDALGVIQKALEDEDLAGPVNATSPNPVTNEEFTRSLSRVLGRPALFSVPASALRLAVGEMADVVLLASQRVVPTRLQAAGFTFRYPDLEGALRHVLGREGGSAQA